MATSDPDSATDPTGLASMHRSIVAQKFHASTDPDAPPAFVNDRVRDVADPGLIRDAFFPDGPVQQTSTTTSPAPDAMSCVFAESVAPRELALPTAPPLAETSGTDRAEEERQS